MSEFSLAEIIVGIVITWTIGLTPPILIRFVIWRQPVRKWISVGICIFFWITNLMIFIMLGSQSKNHTALVLVAFVSYWLLRRGAEPKKAEPKDDKKRNVDFDRERSDDGWNL